MKVLLVEDAQGMRKLVSTMLQGMGFTDVIEAANGAEGWKRLTQHDIDLVLTDWNMPIMDGIELVEKIRRAPGYEALPILLFTARTTKEDVLRALQAGIDTYITKPFTPQQLHAKIQTVLRKRSRQQVNDILRNVDDIDHEDDYPIIIFGESVTTSEDLSLADNKNITTFLANTTTGVRNVDERTPDYHIGYLLVDSTSDVSKIMHVHKERVKILMISNKLKGGGVTLARLASINNHGSIGIYIVCDQLTELTTKERFGLDRLDVTVFERHLLQTEDFEQMINEKIVAVLAGDVPVELPSPEEIRKRIDNDIRNMIDLPVLPQVYHQIVALDKDPESEMQDWIAAAETDPLSAAQIIRRSRSPMYGFQGEINDVGKAIVLLGKNTVKEMVIYGAVKRSFEGIQEQGFSVEEYWLHSVGVAIAARILAFPFDEKAWTPQHRKEFEDHQLSAEAQEALKEFCLWEKLKLMPAHDPFIGGMMHDIGKVALIQSYPGLYPIIIDELKRENWNTSMRAVEHLVAGGAHHNMVGQILSESWKLGDMLTKVISDHHTPPADDPFCQLIALADFVGGYIYPYPKDSEYPMTKILRDESMQADAEPPEGLTAIGAEQDKGEQGEQTGETETAPAEETPPAEESQAEAPVEGEEKKEVSLKEPGPAAGLTPGAAIYNFLPPNLLQRLDLDINKLIIAARHIKPTVERLTEEIRKSV